MLYKALTCVDRISSVGVVTDEVFGASPLLQRKTRSRPLVFSNINGS